MPICGYSEKISGTLIKNIRHIFETFNTKQFLTFYYVHNKIMEKVNALLNNHQEVATYLQNILVNGQ